MDRHTDITMRCVESSDLDVFYRHQLDPEANRMAAFVGRDPADKAAFMVRWKRILTSPGITTRTIVVDGQVAGHISCYPDGGHKEVTYWIGREFWAKGWRAGRSRNCSTWWQTARCSPGRRRIMSPRSGCCRNAVSRLSGGTRISRMAGGRTRRSSSCAWTANCLMPQGAKLTSRPLQSIQRTWPID